MDIERIWKRCFSRVKVGTHGVSLGLLVPVLLGVAVAHTEAQTARVIGFDRFGRHGGISKSLAGQLLVSELGCVSCHPSERERFQPKRGPKLDGVGNRITQSWLRQYLADPQQHMPGTTMPDVLADLPPGERHRAINALTAFLGSQVQSFQELKAGGASPVVFEFWKHGDPTRGAQLYHTVGCVACHAPDADYKTSAPQSDTLDDALKQLDPEELAELGLTGAARPVESIPHGKLDIKYSLRSLAMLLLDPGKTHPNARMPSLRLSPAEAGDIAAFLMGPSFSSVPADIAPHTPSTKLIQEGRNLFTRLRCANCHEVEGIDHLQTASRLAKLDIVATSSCIQNPTADMARYRLDDAQKEAIVGTLQTDTKSAGTTSDLVTLRMLQWNCYGCHERNGLGGVGRDRRRFFETMSEADLGDEGRLPPALDGVGRKLRPQALASVFHPSTSSHRRFLTIRMPSYPAELATSLVSGLLAADRLDRTTELDVLPGGNAQVGRELVNTGCVECHTVRGEGLPGVVGVDLQNVTSRVHAEWFHDFLLEPAALKKRTRMPTFFPNGNSSRPDLLQGHVHRQIASVWQYLKRLDHEPLPEKIRAARSANYELDPQQRPIVLRTFMDAAGTHAIAVGLPGRRHYAFDAERVRMAIAWKGRFLDARGTWFDRFTPPAVPLGKDLVQLPAGSLFQPTNGKRLDFRGYRLDAAGVPTMLYGNDDWSCEDRMESSSEGGLKRTLDVKSMTGAAEAVLQAHAGDQLTAVDMRSFRNELGLTVTVAGEWPRRASLHQSGNQQRWLIPIEVDANETIELEYRW